MYSEKRQYGKTPELVDPVPKLLFHQLSSALVHVCVCLPHLNARNSGHQNEQIILCDIIHHIQNEGYRFVVCSVTNAVASTSLSLT